MIRQAFGLVLAIASIVVFAFTFNPIAAVTAVFGMFLTRE